MENYKSTKPVYRATHTPTTAVVPCTKSILTAIEDKDNGSPATSTFGKFKMFAQGNEKRDMTLLIRGDVKVLSDSDTSFFGCVNCGYMSFDFSSKNCTKCGDGSMLYYFDGVWKNSIGCIKVGEKDSNVKIVKL